MRPATAMPRATANWAEPAYEAAAAPGAAPPGEVVLPAPVPLTVLLPVEVPLVVPLPAGVVPEEAGAEAVPDAVASKMRISKQDRGSKVDKKTYCWSRW